MENEVLVRICDDNDEVEILELYDDKYYRVRYKENVGYVGRYYVRK